MSARIVQQTSGAATTHWRGRAALTLANGAVKAVLLPGGGHLAHWSFLHGHDAPGMNTLWEAPWRTADPGSTPHSEIAKMYGDEATGQFLATYTGHALCLDGFGPPSAAEAAAGASLHGEASTAVWQFVQSSENAASGSVELPVAGLLVERTFSLLAEEQVLRVEESVTNLRDAERTLHWVQHATFGTPFVFEDSRTTASVGPATTWPLDYEGCDLLARDAAFAWPLAPGTDGNSVDLREIFIKEGMGFVAAAQQTAGRKHGFVAVCSESKGLAVGYVFCSADFPWLTIWEENRARHSAPWHGRVQARGMEFGTTPLPLGNEVVDARGPLFGVPTSRIIHPHETLRAPWLLFAAQTPPGWNEIDDVCVEKDRLVLIRKDERLPINATGVAAFLDGGLRSRS